MDGDASGDYARASNRVLAGFRRDLPVHGRASIRGLPGAALDMQRILIGLAGIAVILLIAFALSNNRRAIRLRVVGAAFALQAAIAVLVLYAPWGSRGARRTVRTASPALLGYAKHGHRIPVRAGCANPLGGNSFAIAALPVIIFFAAWCRSSIISASCS